MNLRHSHEILVDDESHTFSHSHECDPSRYWDHDHRIEPGRGMRVSERTARAIRAAELASVPEGGS